MKFVIQEYGTFLLEGMVMVLLITLAFVAIKDEKGNVGVFAITGANIEVETIDYAAYKDVRETYKTESEKSIPKITCQNSNLKVGVHEISQYIKAVDYEGKVLPVTVIDIVNPNGIAIMDAYNQETSEVNMETSGVYQFTVVVSDDINQSIKAAIQIPVNK